MAMPPLSESAIFRPLLVCVGLGTTCFYINRGKHRNGRDGYLIECVCYGNGVAPEQTTPDFTANSLPINANPIVDPATGLTRQVIHSYRALFFGVEPTSFRAESFFGVGQNVVVTLLKDEGAVPRHHRACARRNLHQLNADLSGPGRVRGGVAEAAEHLRKEKLAW